MLGAFLTSEYSCQESIPLMRCSPHTSKAGGERTCALVSVRGKNTLVYTSMLHGMADFIAEADCDPYRSTQLSLTSRTSNNPLSMLAVENLYPPVVALHECLCFGWPGTCSRHNAIELVPCIKGHERVRRMPALSPARK